METEMSCNLELDSKTHFTDKCSIPQIQNIVHVVGKSGIYNLNTRKCFTIRDGSQ